MFFPAEAIYRTKQSLSSTYSNNRNHVPHSVLKSNFHRKSFIHYFFFYLKILKSIQIWSFITINIIFLKYNRKHSKGGNNILKSYQSIKNRKCCKRIIPCLLQLLLYVSCVDKMPHQVTEAGVLFLGHLHQHSHQSKYKIITNIHSHRAILLLCIGNNYNEYIITSLWFWKKLHDKQFGIISCDINWYVFVW